MAKKPSKPTRRARAPKDHAAKKSRTKQKKSVASSAQTMTASVASTPAPRPKKLLKAESIESQNYEVAGNESGQPGRTRMIINAVALTLVIVVLLVVAAIIRQQHSQPNSMAQSSQSAINADKILQSGGNVCTNGASAPSPNMNGSTSPQSIGMLLQQVPENTIQTPQTLSTSSSDLMTLQAASCY